MQGMICTTHRYPPFITPVPQHAQQQVFAVKAEGSKQGLFSHLPHTETVHTIASAVCLGQPSTTAPHSRSCRANIVDMSAASADTTLEFEDVVSSTTMAGLQQQQQPTRAEQLSEQWRDFRAAGAWLRLGCQSVTHTAWPGH